MFHRGATLTNNTIMKRLTNLLPALALVLGAFAAVAFSPKEIPTDEYGYDNGIWYNVAGQIPGDHTYRCNFQEDTDCLYATADESTPLDPGEDRVFVKMPPAIAE